MAFGRNRARRGARGSAAPLDAGGPVPRHLFLLEARVERPMSYPGGPSDTSAPPPPPPPPAPTYSPPPPVRYAPAGGSSYPPTASQGPKWPPWLDIGLLVIGIGALLTFIGFLFGDGFAANAFTTNPTSSNITNARGDLEAFFVVTGFGILLIVGGWFFRVIQVARRGRP